jgi:phosphorylcholine metabolism protein LicD
MTSWWKVVLWILLALVIAYIIALIITVSLRRQKRSALIRMFRETIDTFHAHDVKYVLCWGTLLGGIREGKIIEYDDDVDFVIFGKHERIRAMNILNLKYPNRVNFENNRLYNKNGRFRSLHVDFDYANLIDGMWVRDDPMGHLGKMPGNTISDRVQISMHGLQPYVPHDSHAVLLDLYGDNYMTPIPYKKTDGDWRHNYSELKMRALFKKLGLYV